MTREEFITLIQKHDKLYGNYTSTLSCMDKRELRVNNADEKIIGIVEYLLSKNIGFMVMEIISKPTSKHSLFADVYIPKYKICIRNVKDSKVSKNKAQAFFLSNSGVYYPVFCRHNESLEFVIEKLENTMRKLELNPLKCKYAPESTKKKRQRIKAVKV